MLSNPSGSRELGGVGDYASIRYGLVASVIELKPRISFKFCPINITSAS